MRGIGKLADLLVALFETLFMGILKVIGLVVGAICAVLLFRQFWSMIDGANLGTFATGANADGVAFDGSNIWVANSFSNTLSKIRATDGANLGTVATGANPGGVAFDGVNIWVPNNGSDTVSKY